ncbi:MAG: hypothetical protein KKH22_11670 [Proteobacteria bacterium]|nr:hypothetical protein [Pseudomonadota bacterium]
MKIGKRSLSCLSAVFMAAVMMISPVFAGLNVQLEVVSGKVVNIQANRTVTLDDGKIYYPGTNTVNLAGVKAGDVLTLKYYIQTETKRIFVEYALGRDSLARPPRIEQPAPVPNY